MCVLQPQPSTGKRVLVSMTVECPIRVSLIKDPALGVRLFKDRVDDILQWLEYDLGRVKALARILRKALPSTKFSSLGPECLLDPFMVGGFDWW